jgi:glycosyltransferase involved in cell wall biosynthesis
MKKILIIYRVFADEVTTKGVHRKMLEQGRSLERLGAKVDMINLHSKGIQVDGKLEVIKNLQTASSRNLFNLFDFYNEIRKLDFVLDYDAYYIRYSPLSLGFISFLKFLKKSNPNCNIYIELPTYPFINEYSGLKKLMVQIIGQRQKKLKNYVTNIVSVGNEQNIWGIPVKKIKNAIDPESYRLRNAVKVPGVIRLVMVSTFFNWHGIDRLVNGMKIYMSNPHKKYNIYLTLVGEGPELNKIRTLTENELLKDNVFFTPSTFGAELNQYFDQADIAIGTLAVDRLNLEDCSALKHREYGARGIPFIYAGSDISFNGKDFTLCLPLQEKEIDFLEIEKFYEKLDSDASHYLPQAIKSRVSADLSWEAQLGFLLK